MSGRGHLHAAKLQPGCVTWVIVELLQARGPRGATTRECKQAVEAAGHELMNVGAALMDIRKRAPIDLGCVLRSEPGPKVGRSRVYRYFLDHASCAPVATPQAVEVATPAPQASRSDDRSEAEALGLLFDDRPVHPV